MNMCYKTYKAALLFAFRKELKHFALTILSY